MNISGKAGSPPINNIRASGSFSESLRKEDAPKGDRSGLKMVAAKASRAGDLASGLGALSPDFTPAAGEGMLDAIALAEGATEEMRRYEEKINHRR